jgi:hypothetical protein
MVLLSLMMVFRNASAALAGAAFVRLGGVISKFSSRVDGRREFLVDPLFHILDRVENSVAEATKRRSIAFAAHPGQSARGAMHAMVFQPSRRLEGPQEIGSEGHDNDTSDQSRSR